MPRITDELARDHARLGALLARARGTDPVAPDAYAAFRAGLLQHIAIEEKVLLPAARDAAGAPLARAAALRADHARIAALLAAPPDAARCAELAALLERHDAIEEGPDGVYAECEALLGAARSRALTAAARALPAVRVAPYREPPPREARR